MNIILSIDSITYPLTGIGRYTYEIAHGLKARNSGILFMRSDKISQNLVRINEHTTSKHSLKRLIQKSKFAVDVYHSVIKYKQARALRNYRDYIFHGTNFFIPSFKGKRVSTIHDLSVFEYPEYFEKSKIAYLQNRTRYAIEQADAIITPSEFIKKELINKFQISANKVFATQLASSGLFKPMNANQTNAILGNYLLKHKAYTLFVGTIEPRKNLETLLVAYSMLPKELRESIPLVVVGYSGWNSRHIHVLMRKATEEGWLKYLGYLPSNELPYLFAGARLFVYPSWYEGFGLPVLEAMSASVPVLSSNAASLPEVLGDTGAYFSPDNIEQFYQQLEEKLQDDIWLQTQSERGLLRAGQFSWEKCLNATLDVYKIIL